MVQMKFVGMLLGLLFIMNALRDYYALAHQDMELGSHSELVAAATTAQNHHKELGGRKMGLMNTNEDKRSHGAAAFSSSQARSSGDRKVHNDNDNDNDERLMEETRKIVALMHRDYKGMNKPRRKPPINNHLPIH